MHLSDTIHYNNVTNSHFYTHYTDKGDRKYLAPEERLRFADFARLEDRETRTKLNLYSLQNHVIAINGRMPIKKHS